MILREWIQSYPDDLFDSEKELLDYAIMDVRENIADDYCVPSLWDAWIVEDSCVCVTRLSNHNYPMMKSGYCFESRDIPSRTCNEDWDTNIYTPNGDEIYLRRLPIDGSICNVWKCMDGIYRAQLAVLTDK